MPKDPIKVIILSMKYDEDTNLFYMKVQDVAAKKQTELAIKGTDFGITPQLCRETIDYFCKQMEGKEKNLYIEVDKTTIGKARQDSGKNKPLSKEKVDQVYDNLSQYPIPEMGFRVMKEDQGES